MTPRSTLAAAAMAAVLALSPPAMAQVTLDESLRAHSAITQASRRAGLVVEVGNVPSLGVVNLTTRSCSRRRGESPDPQAYRILAAENAGGVERLRQALSGNPATRRAPEERGLDINRIVGADVGSNGALRVYVIR